jgi:uncharacterized membrane protein HdeD (DUF308 family)
MDEVASRRWQTRVGTGIAAILVGFLALLIPGPMTDFFGIFSGIFVIMLSGIILAEDIFIRHRHGAARWAGTGLALLGILAGIIILAVPAWLVIAAGVFMGGYLVLYGCLEIFAGLSVDVVTGTRILELLSGLIGIVAGIIVILVPVASLVDPAVSVLFTTIMIGMFLILFGILRVVNGLRHKAASGAKHSQETGTGR